MSKVAEYLQSHINGDLSVRSDIRDAFSTDGSVLSVKPEVVVYPMSTNDVRKVARFTWQLSEKGHALPVTPRGFGGDTTGAALSSGIILSMSTYLSTIFEHDTKQGLMRTAAGASVSAIQDALRLDGSTLLTVDRQHATVGGVIANGSQGMFSGKYGSIANAVHQLEVVLPNGDILQTERISKRELEKKKGLATTEGDIYRGIDTILEDHADLIDTLQQKYSPSVSGYPGILRVRDGNYFDLTPLFVGSQGTLGVITEAILHTNVMQGDVEYALFGVPTLGDAIELLEAISDYNPALLEVYDMHYLRQAEKYGRSLEWCKDVIDIDTNEVVVLCGFDDKSARHRARNIKKVQKMLSKNELPSITTYDMEQDDILSVRDMPRHIVPVGARVQYYSPHILSGFYVPREAFGAFIEGLDAIGEKLSLDLPLYGSALTSIYSLRVPLSPKSVTDKQKIFKLIDAVAELVAEYDGALAANNGEGRLLSPAVKGRWPEELALMNEQIRDVFDVHRIANPQTKNSPSVKEVAKLLRSETAVRQPEHPTTI